MDAESVKESGKVHACPKCDKTFSRAVNRDRHLATHNKLPSLVCSICERRFHRPDVLAKHVQRHRLPETVEDGAHSASGDVFHGASSSQLGSLTIVQSRSGSAATHTNEASASLLSSRSLAASRRVARACSRCSKAKARCDGTLPACSRCIRLDKASMCDYDASAHDPARSSPRASASGATIRQPDWFQVKLVEPETHADSVARDHLEQSLHLSSTPTSIHLFGSPRPKDAPPAPDGVSMPRADTVFDATPQYRLSEQVDLESWRQSQVQFSNANAWTDAVSPLPMDWLLQQEIPDDGWTAYLGDPGVPLLTDFFNHADPTATGMRGEPHLDAASIVHHHQQGLHHAAAGASSSRRPSHYHNQSRRDTNSSHTSPNGHTARAFPRAAASRLASNAASPATTDAADAAATLARIRSEAVTNGFMRSGTPSDEGSRTGSEPEAVRPSLHQNRPPAKRARLSEATHGRSVAARPTRASSPDSSSESSDLDPMERANRDVAAQSRHQRVSYRHPDPSARVMSQLAVSAQSPEDIARQEIAAEEMAQLAQHGSAASPRAPSDLSSKRRKRRQKQWPSVYRPKATDGGRHLSLHKVPLASEEVTALENSFQVAPMTDLAKERMIDEFRYCEVEAEDLQRIQDTLRSIKTSTLNLFVQLYFEHYDPILPILHRATFDPDTCDPLLLAAITCLGALCSKAENAFSYCLLTSSLVHAVSYKLFGINHLRHRYLPSMQTLFLTYALWRNLGDPAKLEYLEGFRNTVLTMARRCRLFELEAFEVDRNCLTISASSSPAHSNPSMDKREQEWLKWVRNQEMVRFNWALLILDSDLSLAWDLPCTVTISELRSPLPCTESLWLAESPEDWALLARVQLTSVEKWTLRHLLSMRGSAGQPSTAEAIVPRLHTSPLTRLVLSAAVFNVAVSRWNVDAALTQLAELHDDDEGDDAQNVAMVPRKDTELEAWTDAMALRSQELTLNRIDTQSKDDAQLMLYGARLRMLVSFKAVQIMSGRKGQRRSKLQMKKWMQGPLRQEQYRDDVFRAASKIFALSLAARRDIAPINLEPANRPISGFDPRARGSSRGNAHPSSQSRFNTDPGLSNMAHATVSGTGAENSILFYATVCLTLLCQYLVLEQSASQLSELNKQNQSAGDAAAVRIDRPTPERAVSASRKARKKEVYFVQGVGALTNSVSLDRLIHVAIHQGLNRSAWPLGHVLGKVLQQWARTLVR
ncbi:hypothetical protein PHSY_003372 [Pseudozyma hubeiensis SY62]|uniref:Zn(2)-C6 fungal-type domain-containing protein n=1 Tax=Pseudozyma hubeiensis (strain SY62) TaxID=1305764 RepID=R9P377_PSEHS|nr:hypothetical protein PHSY_003372 [Pseudozyma hubeiensis SY62]GAC95796.1 hypothetical protein PHSY_003372 [Pseudozyma hubeiensis SY62]